MNLKLKNKKIKKIWKFVLDINQDVFTISLITYLVFLLLEEFKKGFVSYNLNLNILLGLVIASGVLTVLSEEKTNKHKLKTNKNESRINKKDYFFIFGLGILGAILIFYKTKEIGWISYIISIVSGVLIILLSVLILEDNDDDSTN